MNKKWLWILIPLAWILISLIHELVANYLDSRKFSQVQSAVNVLAMEFNSSFEASLNKTNSYCRYNQEKFGNGALICIAEIREDQSKEYELSELKKFINSRDRLTDGVTSESEKFREVRFSLNEPEVGCVIENSQEMETYSLSLRCSGISRKSHYPLAE